MDISIRKETQPGKLSQDAVVLDIALEAGDIEQLRDECARARVLEAEIPASARTARADAGDEAYLADFIQTRVTNDALESYGIVPVARPYVEPGDVVDGVPRTVSVTVHPRPEFRLSSLDPAELRTKRVVKPGFSARAGSEGDDSVEFLEDEKTLRIAMLERLVGELPEGALRALGAEYQRDFEIGMANQGIDPDMYREAHGISEEQYALMMTRNALSDARWAYALDAVFAGMGMDVTRDDLAASYELQAPGFSAQLLELHELRNDLYPAIEKVRHGKALKWLRENVLE